MILFADTSTDSTRIALIDRDQFIDEEAFDSKGMQTELLILKIDEILKRNKADKSMLRAIYVVKGPGSYTGLRVGISTLNAAAFALNIPVVGIEANLTDRKIISGISKKKGSGYKSPVLPKYLYPPKISKAP